MKMDSPNEPLVSVLLCCYNGERYIKETIDSVLNQSYSNFEFIIWNDGSTDNTESIIKSYHDKRIRYFYHSNLGLGRSLYLACHEIKGKYIARIDADDICLKDRLKTEVCYMERHPSCSLVSSSTYDIDDGGIVFNWSPPYTNNRLIKKILNTANNIIAHPAAMIRTDAYNTTDGYTSVIGYEDILLWFQLMKTGDLSILPYPTINYRYLQNSISHIVAKTPYDGTIIALLKKMSGDDHYEKEDIELLSKLYDLGKSHKSFCKTEQRIRGNWRMLSIIMRFFGEKTIMTLLCFLKNGYGFIKY